MLLWDRGRDEFVAGSGAAADLVVREPASVAELEQQLAQRMADDGEQGPGWIGGLRFAPQREPSPSWASFGAGWWFRPRLWRLRRDGLERRGSAERSSARQIAAAAEIAVPSSPGEAPRSYLQRVGLALTELDQSQLEKVVLARSIRREGRIDPVATLTALAAREPLGTLYWLAPDAHHGFFGVTPETLYRREGTDVETEALAATAPISDAGGAALLCDEKSLREHNYVRDAIARTLGTVTRSIEMSAEPKVLTLARLHHLHTPIRAELHEARSLLSRLHPTPAVCGTPSAAAEAAIARLESVDRGLYAGAVGWWHSTGESVHVALRGAHYASDASTAYQGAGIVRGSIPASELAELDLKAASLFEAWTDADRGVRP